MSEQRLEQVMVDFWERRADVLVCTTIVEAGLDISTANTLLIERADLLGLSQLHQLRGRVGRGRERGLRLLPLPAGQAADRDRARPTGHHRRAHRSRRRHGGRHEGPGDPRRGQHARRRAVRPHRRRRLRPLHPAGRRGGRGVPRRRTPSREPEVRIELPVDAHLPTDYVESERLRLEMYKRLAEVRDRGRRRGGRGRARRPLRRAAGRGRATCWRWPGSGCWPGAAGPERGRRPGQLHPVRPGRAARVEGPAAEAALSGQRDQGGGRASSWCPGRESQTIGGPPIVDTELLTWCHRSDQRHLPGLSRTEPPRKQPGIP